jgi:phosphate transport system protein
VKAVFYNQNPEKPQLARDIRRLEQDILRMGALVEKSFRLCHQGLFAQNLTAIEEIPLLEKKIDRFYRQIESDCTLIMAAQLLTAQDLRCLSAFMQLVRDLERVGDYAQELADIAVKLFPYPAHPSIPEIAIMSHHAQAMLATSLGALANFDEVGGRGLQYLDDAVDNAYHRLYHTLASQRDIQGVVEPILLLGLVIRYLERMADHATNIGNRVAYIVTGQHP